MNRIKDALMEQGRIKSVIVEQHQNEIVVEGEHFIGKSKSAQYGKVFIELLKNDKTPDYSQNTLFTDEENIKYLIVYAESRLIFYDNLGQATLQPEAKDFGLDENLLKTLKSRAEALGLDPLQF